MVDNTQLPGIFSDSNLAKEVQKVDELPKEEVNFGVVAENGDAGVELTASKDLPHDFYVEGDASWMKKTGYKVAALIGWRPKSKS